MVCGEKKVAYSIFTQKQARQISSSVYSRTRCGKKGGRTGWQEEELVAAPRNWLPAPTSSLSALCIPICPSQHHQRWCLHILRLGVVQFAYNASTICTQVTCPIFDTRSACTVALGEAWSAITEVSSNWDGDAECNCRSATLKNCNADPTSGWQWGS